MSTLTAPCLPQTLVPPPSREEEAQPRTNYLNVAYGVKSWLLTTDHKRIALLYLVSVTLLFFVGGAAATLIRHQLADAGRRPGHRGHLQQAVHRARRDHGVLLPGPGVPTVLGNFFCRMMIGAKDLAFPRLNLLSWYVFMVGAACALWSPS